MAGTQSSSNLAIGYVRVSTTEQALSGLGLADQEERIRAYSTAAGLDLADLCRDEGVSGGTPIEKRPGGGDLLRAVQKRPGARHVVALKLDRLFRDAADCLTQTRVWDKSGVSLHLLDMGGQAINTGSAMGRMFLTMAAGFAELERNLIGERTAAALAVKRSRGEKTGGDVPFGFRVARDGKTLVENDVQQETIRVIRELRTDGLTLRAIGGELQRLGMAPSRGTWHPQKIANILRRA